MEKSPFRIFGLDTSFGLESDPPSKQDFSPKSTALSRKNVLAVHADPAVAPGPKVRVRLGDFLPLLMAASQDNRMWIDDFSDDLMEVTQDLYEVAIAYGSMRRAA
jgi:hypothetical protein